MIGETARPEAQEAGRRRPWARWAARLGSALAVLGVLAILGLILATAALGHLSGYRTYVMYGSSMEPTIKLGSFIVTKTAQVDDLQVGDIISFRSPGSQITLTHRIVGAREEDSRRYFQTKGDAVEGADPQEVQLQGQVQKFAYELPYLGYIVHFAKSPLAIVLLVVLPAAGMMALQMTEGRKDRDSPDLAREGEKPAAKPVTAYDSGSGVFSPPAGPRRPAPALLLTLAGGGLIALLVTLALLAVWLTDSGDNTPAGAAGTGPPSAAAGPPAAPPPATEASTPAPTPSATPAPGPGDQPYGPSGGALFRLAVWDGNEWQFNLAPDGTSYRDGEAVPFLLRIDNAQPGDTYPVTIRYDCNAFDFLTAYDRDHGSEPALASDGPGSPIADSAAPIPDDPATPADDQEAGSFSLWGASFTRVDPPLPSTACTGEKSLTVALFAAADTVFLMWAAQLSEVAPDGDVAARLVIELPTSVGVELSVEIDR